MPVMDTESLVTDTEHDLHVLATELTVPHERECLLCYVHRMLELGCTGLRSATRYRDLKAPRVTGLERRLSSMGACCCDCEILLNAFELAREFWMPEREYEENGATYYTEPEPPEQLPDCRGARAGSTKGCTLWVKQWRGY
jgi:hypothetical protein